MEPGSMNIQRNTAKGEPYTVIIDSETGVRAVDFGQIVAVVDGDELKVIVDGNEDDEDAAECIWDELVQKTSKELPWELREDFIAELASFITEHR